MTLGTSVSAQFGGSFNDQIAPLPEFGSVAPGVSGLFAGLSLIATPNYPGPFEPFSVELSAPDEGYAGATIKWYIDGVEDLSARNQRQNKLTAGPLGKAMTIRVTLEKRGGGTEETILKITPIQIDVVIEANTTVPSFYAGRALPARGGAARATAIITTGSAVDRDNLTYYWELNTTVLGGGPIRGLSSIDFDMPVGFESYIDVTISNAAGVIGRKSVRLTPAEPEIVFYEENPLLGVSGEAFTQLKTVLGNQLTIRGEPYYMNPFKTNSKSLVEWRLNNRLSDNSGSPEINVITLRSDGTGSRGSVSLRMADLSKLSAPISNSFSLQFGF